MLTSTISSVLIGDDVDINECETTNNGGCSSAASCTNIIGSFTCECLTGYTGDGFMCDGKLDLNLRTLTITIAKYKTGKKVPYNSYRSSITRL